MGWVIRKGSMEGVILQLGLKEGVKRIKESLFGRKRISAKVIWCG